MDFFRSFVLPSRNLYMLIRNGYPSVSITTIKFVKALHRHICILEMNTTQFKTIWSLKKGNVQEALLSSSSSGLERRQMH